LRPEAQEVFQQPLVPLVVIRLGTLTSWWQKVVLAERLTQVLVEQVTQLVLLEIPSMLEVTERPELLEGFLEVVVRVLVQLLREAMLPEEQRVLVEMVEMVELDGLRTVLEIPEIHQVVVELAVVPLVARTVMVEPVR
jgi:hypothetical protein